MNNYTQTVLINGLVLAYRWDFRCMPLKSIFNTILLNILKNDLKILMACVSSL